MMLHRLLRVVAGCIAAGALTIMIGCGSSGTCVVSGKLTIKGKPVCTGSINLLAANGDIVTGGIDADGNYMVINAPVGVVKVAVVSEKPIGPGPISAKREPGSPPPTAAPVTLNWVPVDAKYADPATSGKEITLKSGSNVINIDLE